MRRHTALTLFLVAIPFIALAGRPNKRLSDADRGELLYQRHCQACHGATNSGQGPATTSLVVEIPDLRGQLSKANREDNASLVLDGSGAMPGFKVSFDRYDARRVLRYMETLPAEQPEAAEAAEVVEEEPSEEDEELQEGGDIEP